MRKILFEESAGEDLFFWAQTDQKILKKIVILIESIQKEPFKGIGKPEPLKYNLTGFWSRKINDSHRLVYKVTENQIIIAACRFHY